MQSELEGIAKLRRGVLILIIVPIIATIAIVSVGITIVSSMMPVLSSSSSSALTSSLFSILTDIGILVAVFLIAIILVIVGYLYLRRGFKILVNLGRNVKTGYSGTTLFFVSLALFIIGVIIVIATFAIGMSSISSSISSLTNSNNAMGNLLSGYGNILAGIYAGGALAIIGWIILIVGNILIGIGFFEVGNEYNEGTTKVGGILMMIGAVLSFLILFPSYASIMATAIILASLIIVYVGLGKIRPMGSISTPTPLYQQTYQQPAIQQTQSMPPVQPPVPPQIYQAEQGVIKNNGNAYITLYSTIQATIVSARIEGSMLTSNDIKPSIIQPGQNEIVIKFNDISVLVPGVVYSIILAFDIGGNISETRVSALYIP